MALLHIVLQSFIFFEGEGDSPQHTSKCSVLGELAMFYFGYSRLDKIEPHKLQSQLYSSLLSEFWGTDVLWALVLDGTS